MRDESYRLDIDIIYSSDNQFQILVQRIMTLHKISAIDYDRTMIEITFKQLNTHSKNVFATFPNRDVETLCQGKYICVSHN